MFTLASLYILVTIAKMYKSGLSYNFILYGLCFFAHFFNNLDFCNGKYFLRIINISGIILKSP